MNKKYIKIILIVFFVGVAGLLFCFYRKDSNDSIVLESTCDTDKLDDNGKDKKSSNEFKEKKNASDKVDDNEKSSATVFVHICGEVNEPGVYEVSSKARVVDVINVAGGLTKEAAGESINQAKQISDSQQVYIPSKKEIKNGNIQKSSTIQKEDKSTTVSSEDVSDKVNINTADETELMKIPGIGEKRAQSIVEYRVANGNFNSIEAIKKVTGIKEGLFKKISSYIVVN